MRHYIFFILLFRGTSGFAQLTDYRILKSINESESPQKTKFTAVLANSVSPLTFLAPVASFGFELYKKPKQYLKNKGLWMGAALLASAAVATPIKYTVKRPRPFITWPDIEKRSTAGTPSFPSGHTSASFNLATSLMLHYQKWYITAPAYLWASGVAFSRMYQGVHYPSDVLFGAISGSATSYLCYIAQKKLLGKKVAVKS